MEQEEMFEKMIDFIGKYSWIFDFKLTDFFIEKVWENIPAEWTTCLLSLSNEELNELPYGSLKDHWPESFKEFLQTALSFSETKRNKTTDKGVDIPPNMKKGMNEKKQHEVSKMAALVHDLTVETGSDVIIDVGSGLGYLGQILNKTYGHRVIGVEGKQSHTSGAEKRSHNTDGIINVTCELENTEDSMKDFQHLLRDLTIKENLIKTEKCKKCKEETTLNNEAENLCFENQADEDQTYSLSSNINCTSHDKTNCYLIKNESSSQNCDSNIMSSNCDKRQVTFDSDIDNKKFDKSFDRNKSAENKFDQICDESEQTNTSSCCCNIPSLMMIGLHCCGDLTPTMMQFYSRLEYIRGLCCVSCCYHRMNFNDEENQFHNFPMSKALATVLNRKPAFKFNLYALRLAAQETRSRWKRQSLEDHEFHTKNVAYRGVLEIYSKQELCDSNKLFRKLTRRGDMSCFTTYIDAVITRTNISNSQEISSDTDLVKEKLQQIYKEYENYFVYIEPITVLQVIMQPLLESLITLDRKQWLEEQGSKNSIVPVFDDSISPRNLCLVSTKAR